MWFPPISLSLHISPGLYPCHLKIQQGLQFLALYTLEQFLDEESFLCIVGCLTTSLAFVHQVLVAYLCVVTTNMSLDIVKYLWWR